MNRITAAGYGLEIFSPSALHEDWLFLYCCSGKGIITAGDIPLAYQPHTILCIPPGMVPNLNQDSSFICCLIEDVSITATGKPFTFMDDPQWNIHSAFTAVINHFRHTPELETIFIAYGQLLVTYALTYSNTHNRSEIVSDILIQIRMHLSDPHFKLDQYLDSLPFSTDYLRRLFKQEVGTTPHQYMIDRRLKAASDFLSISKPSLNIAEIARMCGYQEPLYFSRQFKQKYGMSPSAYAQQVRE